MRYVFAILALGVFSTAFAQEECVLVGTSLSKIYLGTSILKRQRR
jgi:hypothetical protein